MAKMELAIVGCGDIARYTAFFARLNRKIRLSACCDIDHQRATAFARRFGIPGIYTDLDQLLDTGQPQAVYLAVPHDLHLPMAAQSAAAGVAVLCEKPLAASLAEGLELAALARQPGVKIGVNYQYRYDSACYALVQAARNGDLGRLLYLRANIPWHREAGYFTSQSAWHSSLQRSGGGTLLTQGSHFLDILLWAANSQPAAAWGTTARQVFSEVEVEDLAFATVEMENSLILEICSSMIAQPERPATIEIYASRGTALYRDGLIPRLKTHGLRLAGRKPPVRGIHALSRSLEAFRQWVVDDRPYLSTVESALQTLQVVEAVYRAAESGRRTSILPPDPPANA